MRADQMRGLSDEELTSRVAELERERFNLRFRSGTQPLEDPLRLRAIRKDLARLKTIQRERALGVVRPAKAEVAAPATSGRRASARRGR
ncbi:MAG TPA: 50S ribosomal protein L29 [Gemmatimonadaceae bacterium]|nr:50S ribosomal protein L29 [Gemmatimonadaceae bacterium]